MTTSSNLCERIELSAADGWQRLDALRGKLVSQGDVVSPASRQRTIDVFGEPLAPRQVVARICEDVRAKGLPALLDYTKRIDRADVSPETLLVHPEALAAAHAAVAPEFLAAVRRIRDRVKDSPANGTSSKHRPTDERLVSRVLLSPGRVPGLSQPACLPLRGGGFPACARSLSESGGLTALS